MYKATKTEATFFGTRIHYQQFELTSPRCSRCTNFHRENDRRRLKFGIGAGIVGSMVIFIMTGSFSLGFAITSIVILSVIGNAIFDAMGKHRGSDTTKAKTYKGQFPSYRELISNGWEAGEKPANTSQK